MSNFLNDSLPKQIERGEVFITMIAGTNLAPGDEYDFYIATPTNPTSLSLSVLTDTFYSVDYREGAAILSGGVSLTSYNMNREIGGTAPLSITVNPTSYISDGSSRLLLLNYSHVLPSVAPVGTENSLILATSSGVVYRIKNIGGDKGFFSFTLHHREIN